MRREEDQADDQPRGWYEGEYEVLTLAQVIERLQAHVVCEGGGT
jgi:hypothetical protein